MASKRVCRSCTTNPHLKDWIALNGDATERCSFGCSGAEVSVNLFAFARQIDMVIRQNYSPNTNPEDGLADEEPEKVVASAAGISARLARDVVTIARAEDRPSFYDFGISESAPWPMDRGRSWSELVETVKSRARFFGKVQSSLMI